MDELELALEDCLQRMSAGKSSLGQCLARYPQHATELRPMLEAAVRLQEGRKLRPSGSVRTRTRGKIMNYIEQHPRQPRTMRAVPRLAFGMVVLALLLMLTGTGFAQAALPGEPLYGLKLTTERAWRAASPDPVATDLFLAGRRAAELVAVVSHRATTPKDVADQSKAEAAGMAAYTDVLNRLAKEAKGPEGDHILRELKQHRDTLSQAGIEVPMLDDIILHGQPDNNGQQGQGQGNGNGNGGGNGNGNGNNP